MSPGRIQRGAVVALLAALGSGCQGGSRAAAGAVAAAASAPRSGAAAPAGELAGYYPAAAPNQGGVALRPADIAFYRRVMQAAIERTQHPTAADQSALAAYQQWKQGQAQENQQVLAAARSGHLAGLANLPNHPVPATAALAEALLGAQADTLAAAGLGMPGRQWQALRGAVEQAAAPPCATPLPSPSSPTLAREWDNYVASCEGGSGGDGRGDGSAAQRQAAARRAAVAIQTLEGDRRALGPQAAAVAALRRQLLQSAVALGNQYHEPDPLVQERLQALRLLGR
ncbi:MAG TPA: hypothetical protein VMV31_11825 [Terriglobales bacterium]|nr:hypothetical protein [Terriglobales bacterium]